MTGAYKKPKRVFIPSWVAASTIGILIAGVITWAILSLAESITGGTMQVGDRNSPTEDVLAMWIFIPLLGLSTGFFQWLLLRRYLSRIGWWILATFMGWPLAFTVLLVPYTFLLGPGSPDSIWALGLASIIIGGSMGFTQWLALRKHIENAKVWILVNIISWSLLGLAIGKSITSMQEIAAFSLVPAVAIGTALWLLLNQTRGGAQGTIS